MRIISSGISMIPFSTLLLFILFSISNVVYPAAAPAEHKGALNINALEQNLMLTPMATIKQILREEKAFMQKLIQQPAHFQAHLKSKDHRTSLLARLDAIELLCTHVAASPCFNAINNLAKNVWIDKQRLEKKIVHRPALKTVLEEPEHKAPLLKSPILLPGPRRVWITQISDDVPQ